jgi:hypothetical protein
MFSSACVKKKGALCILFICLESDFVRKHKVEKLKESREKHVGLTLLAFLTIQLIAVRN